jgi:hypothetical protein
MTASDAITIGPHDDALLMRQAARELGITGYKAQQLRAAGVLRVREIGGYQIVLRADVERARRVLAEREQSKAPAA